MTEPEDPVAEGAEESSSTEGLLLQIRILGAQGNTLRFYISGVDTEVANALRRTMMADVPTMAIEDVVVVENTSPMRDEMLSHRLGLIPLKTDLESYIPREFCDCQSELGCGKCSVTLTLEAEAADSSCTVYSKALDSSDPEVVPVNGEIPILKLAKGQKVKLEAYARLGTGREHAKWQPVAVSVFKNAVRYSVAPKKCDLCGGCVKACPRHILQEDDQRIILVAPEDCDLCYKCKESCPKEALSIIPEKNAFVFTIESTGALPPEKIFNKALGILTEKSDDLVEQFSIVERKAN